MRLFGIGSPLAKHAIPNQPAWVEIIVPRFILHDEPTFADLVFSHLLILFVLLGAYLAAAPVFKYILPLAASLGRLFVILTHMIGAIF